MWKTRGFAVKNGLFSAIFPSIVNALCTAVPMLCPFFQKQHSGFRLGFVQKGRGAYSAFSGPAFFLRDFFDSSCLAALVFSIFWM